MKNCLAFFGAIFLILALFAGAFLVWAWYTDPDDVFPQPELPPLALPTAETRDLLIETPFATPVPTPTPTPIPDPVGYQTRVVLRARHFATTLRSFLDINGRLNQNPGLIDDPNWNSEVTATLDEFLQSTRAMSEIEPVPPEYQAIDDQLHQVAVEAQILHDSYLLWLATRDPQYSQTAGDSLARITEGMGQAELRMAEAGWILR